MRKSRKLALIASILLVCASSVCANPPVRKPKLLLSIFTDNHGMTSPIGRYLYVEIDTLGNMTYTEYTGGIISELRRELSTPELAMVTRLLQSDQFRSLGDTLGASNTRRTDYQVNVVFDIPRNRKEQRFTIRNYDSRILESYPSSVGQLLCVVDALRASHYKLTTNCGSNSVVS